MNNLLWFLKNKTHFSQIHRHVLLGIVTEPPCHKTSETVECRIWSLNWIHEALNVTRALFTSCLNPHLLVKVNQNTHDCVQFIKVGNLALLKVKFILVPIFLSVIKFLRLGLNILFLSMYCLVYMHDCWIKKEFHVEKFNFESDERLIVWLL